MVYVKIYLGNPCGRKRRVKNTVKQLLVYIGFFSYLCGHKSHISEECR